MAEATVTKQNRKKRKPNYSTNELEILLTEIERNRDVILGKFSDTLTNERKKKVWKHIAGAVSAVSSTVRSDDDIKKKWHDWSSIVKGKQSKLKRERRKTGGGPKDDDGELTVLEERVLQILGTTAVFGIDTDLVGGDTFPTSDTDSTCTSQTGDQNIRSLECDEELDSNENETIVLDDGDMLDDLAPILSKKSGDSSEKPLVELPTESTWNSARKLSSSTWSSTPSVSCSSQKKRKRKIHDDSTAIASAYDIYQLEERKLAVEEKRLSIECERLDIEHQRFACEQEILSSLKELRPSVEMDERRYSSRHSSNPDSAAAFHYMSKDDDFTYTDL